MAANISLFPVITDDLLSKTRFQASPYQLYYVRDDQEYVLRKDGDGDWKILTFYKIEGESSESDE